MILSSLNIHCFRNIMHAEINPSDRFNLFVGGNGSGKTSLLEAIHHLSVARSFKTRFCKHVIQHGAKEFTLFGKMGDLSVGIMRARNGKSRIRIGEKDVQSIAELAEQFPLQVINPDTYQLITAGPKMRRKFVDWGVFHVQHEFVTFLKQLYRVLRHRNAILKEKVDFDSIKQHLEPWDADFIRLSERLTCFREAYVEELRPIFMDLMQRLLDIVGVRIEFRSGWSDERSLESLLTSSLQRDIMLGHTQFGPHRADLLLYVGDHLAQDVLSRGQLKLLVCAMQLAQALLLEKKTSKKCVFLVDDLPSELDTEHRRALCGVLIELETQIFMTCIEQNAFVDLIKLPSTKVFKVDSGNITPFERNTS